MTASTTPLAQPTASDCRTCGACCSFSSEWPRFSLESDAKLDRIPYMYVDEDRGRIRCCGDRCAALLGDVGVGTACAIYAMRPDVCRSCSPGDDACRVARQSFNL
ncbi:MAG: YkgJ family cysteine cluster protein [Xanthobacteraceae bacterium]